MPAATRTAARRSPSTAPEIAPDSTPTRLIPTWTAERKRPGSAAERRGAAAPGTWRSTRVFRRDGREETMASSESASAPLARMSARTRPISTRTLADIDFAGALRADPHQHEARHRDHRDRQDMARVTGLEPATSGVTGRRSNRLSYTRKRSAPHSPFAAAVAVA